SRCECSNKSKNGSNCIAVNPATSRTTPSNLFPLSQPAGDGRGEGPFSSLSHTMGESRGEGPFSSLSHPMGEGRGEGPFLSLSLTQEPAHSANTNIQVKPAISGTPASICNAPTRAASTTLRPPSRQ